MYDKAGMVKQLLREIDVLEIQIDSAYRGLTRFKMEENMKNSRNDYEYYTAKASRKIKLLDAVSLLEEA